MSTQFNPAAHEFLINNGYSYEQIEAHWEDVGGPESGPQIIGHPDYDLYTSDKDRVMIDSRGCAFFEIRNLAFEAFCTDMAEIFDN